MLMQNLSLNDQTTPSKHEVQTDACYDLDLVVRLHKYQKFDLKTYPLMFYDSLQCWYL